MLDIQERTSKKRKEQYDKTCIGEKLFEKSELVLIRNPDLHSKLDSVWDGPFEVMEVPNDMHLIIATLGKKHKRVHVSLCKKFSTPESQVHRLVVSAADDPYLDEPKLVLAGDALNANEREEMNKLLDKWNNVLRDTRGQTVLLHNVDSGQAPPIRSVPYQQPEVWKEPVKEEILEFLMLKIITHSIAHGHFQ